MYKDYIKERENLHTIEVEHGFAIYSVQPDCVYLQDIYVKPEYRKNGIATELLRQVEVLTKAHNLRHILGSCDPVANGSTASLKAILAAGFKLSHCHNNMIYLVKEV